MPQKKKAQTPPKPAPRGGRAAYRVTEAKPVPPRLPGADFDIKAAHQAWKVRNGIEDDGW